jgi:hypothetical protein
MVFKELFSATALTCRFLASGYVLGVEHGVSSIASRPNQLRTPFFVFAGRILIHQP